MKNCDPNLSRQGREFDVENEPMDLLDWSQLVAGWVLALCVGGLAASALGWLK